MLETLALLVTTALTPPLPMVRPLGCKVEATALELVVTSNGAVARYPLGEREVPFAPGASGPPRVTTLPLPGAKDLLLASLRETWDGVAPAGLGHLYEVTCGTTPAIRLALEAPGIDFGRIVLARDGRWIVGGWGGLRVLDPNTKRLTPLTTPPSYAAPCWTAEDGKPARAADVPLVGDDGVTRSDEVGPEEIRFMRAGACGYEAEITATRHALVLDRGIVRRIAAVSTLAVSDDGRILVGDGAGPCARQSPGTLYASTDDATWTALKVRKNGIAGIAHIARFNDEWLALTATCENGGGLAGGDLLASSDLVEWTPVAAVPVGFSDVVASGAGIAELVIERDRVHVAAVQGKVLHWFDSSDARDFRPSATRTVRAVPQALAKTLLVEAVLGLADTATTSYAWTSDGLFAKTKADPAAPWTRIFPR